jgi:hypothetical protein
MKITEYQVSPSSSDRLKGKVLISQEFKYEVFGPFGQGYNIKVSRNFSSATLSYHWRDGGGSIVKTPNGNYEMSEISIFQNGNKILQIDESEEFSPLEDAFVMALFVVNHFYYKKTGPFKNNSNI